MTDHRGAGVVTRKILKLLEQDLQTAQQARS
jgi:hypothetical protein